MRTPRPLSGRTSRTAGRPAQRRLAWTGIITILALILTMFPQVVPGASLPTASAHNLNQSMVYMFFDPDTQKVLDLRAASIVPPQPLLRVDDELGIIIKVIPDEGTNTGVGGYVDFYIPPGTQVIDVGYILPGDNAADGITTGWDKVPMKGQALMPDVGAGGESKFDLTGITRTNPFGVTSTVVNGANANLGTLPGIYGDTGIFYSTIPETAWGSYSNGNKITTNTLTNNSGDLVGNRTVLGGILNEWDAWQLAAYGLSSTGNPAYPPNAIIDSNERGYTPWGMANMVPGPQSGYAWEFDLDVWNATAGTNKQKADAAWQIGPWNRIKYPGSQYASDPPGHRGAAIHAVGGDASNLGAAMPLADTTGWSDGTPNAVRWAVGQLTYNTPEYVWVKIKVNNTAAIMNASGCPIFNADSIGGDAGGDSGGKDHIWRYYDPTDFQWNGCLALGKPATREVVKVGDFYQYKIKMYNAGLNDFSNAVIQDTLVSGVTYVSATPAPSVVSGSTLQWNVSPFLRGQMFEAIVTVKASGSGLLENKVCSTGTVSSGPAGAGNTVTTCSGETTPGGSVPLLKQNKFVDNASIAPGGSVQWTIDVENIGSGPTGTPIKIEDHLPAGFTYQTSPAPTVYVNGALVTNTTVSGTAQDPIFSVPVALQAGKKLTITFTAKSDPNINPGSYCNYYTNYAPSIPLTTAQLACVAVGGGAIGDTVWRDWNNNGAQDPGEEGLSGVDVKLHNGSCPPTGSPVQTKTTDANGFYRFTGLTNGSYCVDPVNPGAAGGAPAGYTLTTANDPKTVTLTTANPQDYTVDFGYKPGGSGSIGDTVFEDQNNNGIFDGTDVGIVGAQVILYEDTNGNGVLDAGSDVQVATTTTGAGGMYTFSGLATGLDYLVYVNPADAAVDGQFSGPYTASTPNPQPVDNLTGAYDAADIGFWAVQPGSIGDQVFLDNNKNGIYDSGDLPIPNVTVDLYLDGALLKSTVSDATGKYLFDNLGAGNYTVVVSATDPDVPAGYFPSIIKIDKVLAPNETYLNADFPFTAGLAKTVDKAFAATGNTLNFSLKPYYPGGELLGDVRVIDPIPTGTTYVNGSANAGAVFGAYTPFAAVPGNDPAGGPSGNATLDTAITTSSNYVVKGGSVNVTLNVKSSAAVSVVTPGALAWTGGSATCTGPTPASNNVPSGGSGVNFVWACTLNDVGEYTFSNDASDASGDWTWPSADSASVLSSPGGGPNVVTWNLGSNNPGVPGQTLVSGSLAGIYAFRGVNTKEFSTYNTAWSSKAQPNNGIEKGGSLTGDGAGTLWALEGNSKWFYEYDIATNAWTRLADTSDNSNEGGDVQYLEVGGVKYVYALLGGSNRFRRYAVVANTWANMVNTPASVKKGGALATDGTYLYALQGDTKKGFWRCNATTDNVAGACSGASGSWTTMATMPQNIGWGGSLTRLGNYLYATQGDGKKGFFRCNFTTTGTAGSCNTSWSVLASVPGNMADGGSTTTNGTYIYALQGKTKAFWRYDPATNTWLTLTPVNFTGNVGQGGALAYDPGSSPVGYFSTAFAAPSLVSTGDKIKATLTFSSQNAVNNVAPSALTVTPTGGASATCGSPTLMSADDDIAGASDSVIYEWLCTATAGAGVGSLTFSASATGSIVAGGTATYPSASTKSVLVSPTLIFQATVNAGAPAVVENTGILLETSGTFDSLPSNTTQTGTGASIGDFVWLDLDGDGVQDGGEVGQGGVRVYIDSNNNSQYDAGELNDFTDANGLYRIFGLSATTYNVRLDTTTLPANYQTTTPTLLSVTLTANQQYNLADFGIRPPGAATIGDTVWLDYDRNNTQTPATEPGIPNINVWLYKDVGTIGVLDGGDTLLKQTTTNGNGNYTFTGLYGGNYLVVANPGGTDQVQSPYGGMVNLSTLYFVPGANPQVVTLTDAQNYVNADFGYDWNSSIGDFVWWDTLPDGVYDPNGVDNILGNADDETPISGAQVLLYWDVANNNQWDPGDPYIDQAFTNASGIYSFPDLPAGNYVLEVYEDSFTVGGDREAIPSTPNWQAVDLAAGQNYLNADWGYYKGALIEGHVFHDDNRTQTFDAGETPLPNVTVTLTGTDKNGNPVSQTTTTDTNGYFKFAVPEGTYTVTYNTSDPDIPGSLTTSTTPVSYNVNALAGPDFHVDLLFGRDSNGTIGNLVWNDASGEGLKDASEPGLANVTVRLYLASNPSAPIDTVATDANGEYWFTGVADGLYIVKVDPATLPSGYTQTGDPDPSKDNQGNATITGGNTVDTMDFGYKAPAGTYTVTGTVWEDVDGQGDKDEPGRIPNVKVCLYNATTNALVACTLTQPDGSYTFPGVPNGNYTIKVDPTTLPSPAYVQTGDPDPTKDNQTAVTVSGANPAAKDFGYQQQPGSISGSVCLGNGNGTCDSGEAGITPVPVTLQYAGTDGLIGTGDDPAPVTVLTNANGDYTFPNLLPGVYQITQTNLPGYISLADKDGGNPDVIGVTLTPNQAVVDRDFEDRLPAQVSGTVFEDYDLDGQQDPGEPGIPNVTVALKQGATTVATTTTNGLGEYEFLNVNPGANYTLDETQPAGYVSTKDADLGDPNQIGPFTLSAGQNLTDRDFGEAKPGVISGKVCVDANNNGQCDAGEAGIPSVQVCATPVGGVTPLCGTTDANGNYTIPNVPPGNYTVSENPQPAGYVSSSPDILPVTVGNGQTVPNVNFAEVTPLASTYTVSGTVCSDKNGDRVCDPTEAPLPNVTVRLYDPNGNVVATTTTDANGDYKFPNVAPGNYNIVEVDPPNYTSVNDAVGANDNNIPVTVSNANLVDQDFIDAPAPGKLSGTVYEDLNLNGQRDAGEPGIPNVTVSLNTGATDVTDANGFYEFTNLPPATYTITEQDPAGYISTGDVDGANDNKIVANLPAGGSVTGRDFGDAKLGSINGTVWNDLDKDGAQDPGEPGLPNVVVCATPTAGGAPICDTTDANGNYNIPGLPPGGYVVTETDPAGYTSTTPNSVPVNLGSGQNTDAPDFGDAVNDPALGSIAGTVCKNVNGNGVCGDVAGETGLPGVTVQLYQGNTLLRTTTTDALGNYLFDNLPAANDYNVREVNPTGYTSVTDADGNGNGADKIDPIAVSGNNVIDRDFVDTPTPGAISGKVCDDTNRNGVCESGEPGLGGVTVTLYDSNGNPTPKVTAGDGTYSFPNLPPDTYTIVETDNPGYLSTGDVYGLNDNTIVVPLAPGTTVGNQNFADAPIPGAITGTVYNDLNGDGNFDPGEPGLPGVTVCLTPPGAPNGCVTTNAAGQYSFTNLAPGSYTVTETDPAGYNSTGDADGNGNGFNTIAVTVPSGVTVTERNFFDNAPVGTPAISVLKTLKNTATSVRVGQKITYNIAIQNTGNVAITVLPLVDTYNTTFLTYGYGTSFATPASDDNINDGTINWTDLTASLGDLVPGQTVNVEVVFTAREDTTTYPGGKADNTAKVEGAQAGAQPVPTQESTAQVEILKTTGVSLVGFAAVRSERGVNVTWETADENAVLGFNVLRQTASGAFEAINPELILAQHAGQAIGAVYSFADPALAGTYRLEVVKLDGSVEAYGDVTVAPRR